MRCNLFSLWTWRAFFLATWTQVYTELSVREGGVKDLINSATRNEELPSGEVVGEVVQGSRMAGEWRPFALRGMFSNLVTCQPSGPAGPFVTSMIRLPTHSRALGPFSWYSYSEQCSEEILYCFSSIPIQPIYWVGKLLEKLNPDFREVIKIEDISKIRYRYLSPQICQPPTSLYKLSKIKDHNMTFLIIIPNPAMKSIIWKIYTKLYPVCTVQPSVTILPQQYANEITWESCTPQIWIQTTFSNFLRRILNF